MTRSKPCFTREPLAGLERAARLPAELISIILGQLAQDDLRRASTASWAFYLSAHAAGLELHRTINNFYPPALNTLVEVVQHAAAQSRLFRLALTLDIHCSGRNRPTFVAAMQNILSAVSSALPFLASLRAAFPGHFAEMVYAALTGPAPLLCTLELAQRDNAYVVPVQIPPALLAGAAPCLHTVTLHVFALKSTWAPVRAFAGVRRVNLELFCTEKFNDVAVSWNFPNVSRLDLVATRCGRNQVYATYIDLSALRLRQLIADNTEDCMMLFYVSPLDGDRSAPRLARNPAIASIDYMGQTIHSDKVLWPENAGELNAQIQSQLGSGRVGDVNHLGVHRTWPQPPLTCGKGRTTRPATIITTVSSLDLSWRKTLYTQSNPPSTITLESLEQLSPLRTLLVSLTVDESLLLQLVETPCRLHALRELFLDFTSVPKAPGVKQFQRWPRSTPTFFCMLGCPALERVTVFATDTDPTIVSASKIASFGRLLLRNSLRLLNVELVLMHTRLDVEEERFGLEEIFCPIRVDAADNSVFPMYFRHRG